MTEPTQVPPPYAAAPTQVPPPYAAAPTPPPPPEGRQTNWLLVFVVLAAVATLLIGLISWLGGDDDRETQVEPPAGAETFAPPGSGYEADLDRTIEDLNTYWAATMPDIYDKAYEQLRHGTLPYSEVQPPPNCGIQQLTYEKMKNNAFYCPPQPVPADKQQVASGDYIAYDVGSLFPKLSEVFGASGVAAVMAHEWGHAIQYRGGAQGKTIELELQADCFAGAWIGRTAQGGSDLLFATSEDVDRAMAALLFFRDPPGTNPANPAAHGNGFDRVVAFEDGFSNGAAACVDYPGTVDYTESTYTTGWEALTGGNASLDVVVPATFDALDIFWRGQWDDAFQTRREYSPIANLVPFPDEPPACAGGAVPQPAEASDLAYYCPQDDTEGWGTGPEGLPVVNDTIGDGAVISVLADRWGYAMRSKAGEDLDGTGVALQVDCTTGAFLKAASTGVLAGFQLSPGDLDEAAASALASTLVAGFTDDRGSGFERVGAMSTGFAEGVGACGEL